MEVILSIINSIYYLIKSNMQFPQKYNGKTVQMEDGLKFKIFRHMSLKAENPSVTDSILIIRFKFKKFSHKTNIRMSRIPILLIAGFPGFKDKLWMIDWKTDYWQGIYQWVDVNAIETYKKSFVLGIMNKRSINNTISYHVIPNKNIDEHLQTILSDS